MGKKPTSPREADCRHNTSKSDDEAARSSSSTTTAATSSSSSSSKRQQQQRRRRRRLWLTREEQELTNSGKIPLTTGSSVEGDGSSNDDGHDTLSNLSYDAIFDEFSIRPKQKSLTFFLMNTIVVGQEFVLTGLFLAGHRAAIHEEERYHTQRQGNNGSGSKNEDSAVLSDDLLTSLGLVWLTILISVVTNRFATSKQYRIQHRFIDFGLIAILIRMSASVLRTLTASFSSDTVYALSIGALFIHFLACDYAYANGVVRLSTNSKDYADENVDGTNDEQQRGDNPDTPKTSSGGRTPIQRHQRPVFMGGTLSLTTAFFATILLASRLRHNMTVYVFVCSSVVLFALFPAARHLVAVKAHAAAAAESSSSSSKSSSLYTRFSSSIVQCVPLIITLILSTALMVLLSDQEKFWVCAMLTIICVVVPMWKFYLQRYKVLLRGPWDIAHV